MIFYCSLISLESRLKYPTTVDCVEMLKYYPLDLLEEYSIQEWEKNINLDEPEYTGYLQCFCDYKMDELLAEGGELDGTLFGGKPICDQWLSDGFYGMILQNAMTIIVVVVNSILKILLISLITWISEDTWSQTYKSITNGIFVTLFFNTAFLLMLTNANFAECGLPGASVFTGRFYDFTESWYIDIGYPLT